MLKVFTLANYYKGRDILYPKELTQKLKDNATYTVACTNRLMVFMEADEIDTSQIDNNSGWRPKSINTATPGADPNSPHVTCEGIDLSDKNNIVKKWIQDNPDKVKEAGFVATEDFSLTSTWCHLQTRPPLSFQKGKFIWMCDADNWFNYHDNSNTNLVCK
jgi:hypothetical protein